MQMILDIFSNFIRKIHNHTDPKSQYIFYKIVDATENDQNFVLQCINTKATFSTTIAEIVFDIDILHGLHPAQACYIGIEYSKHIKNVSPTLEIQKKQEKKMYKVSVCRYGKYKLRYQNRAGGICFIHTENNKELVMDPRDIALSKELINEFDATQAFYIGLLAGFRINNNAIKQGSKRKFMNKPNLRLVR